MPFSQNGHSKTSDGPAMAEYNGKLYLAYKGSGSNDLWYNVFDGTSWLADDLEISQNGRSQTSSRPALAVYGKQLYLAYRGGDSDDIWYNVFDGNNWLNYSFRGEPSKVMTPQSPQSCVDLEAVRSDI